MKKRSKFLGVLTAVFAVVFAFAVASCSDLLGDAPLAPEYTLTYNLDGGEGTVPEPAKYKEGATVTVHDGEGLTKTDHTFAGWKNGTEDVAAGSTFTMPAENVTLKAQWTSNSPAPADTYTLSYDLDGGQGTVPQDTDYAEGATVTVHDGEGLTKDGHVFAGWKNGTEDVTPGSTFTMPAKDVTLTAQWKELVKPEDSLVGKWTGTSEGGFTITVYVLPKGGAETVDCEYYIYEYAEADGEPTAYSGLCLPLMEGKLICDYGMGLCLYLDEEGKPVLGYDVGEEEEEWTTFCEVTKSELPEATYELTGKYVSSVALNMMDYQSSLFIHEFDFDNNTLTLKDPDHSVSDQKISVNVIPVADVLLVEPERDDNYFQGQLYVIFDYEGTALVSNYPMENSEYEDNFFVDLIEVPSYVAIEEGKWTLEDDYGAEYIIYIDLADGQDYAATYVCIVKSDGNITNALFGFLTPNADDPFILEDTLSTYGIAFCSTGAGSLTLTMMGEEAGTTTAKASLPVAPSFSGKMGGFDPYGTVYVIDFTTNTVETDYGTLSDYVTVGDVYVIYMKGNSYGYPFFLYIVAFTDEDTTYGAIGEELFELVECQDHYTVTYGKGEGGDATVPDAVEAQFGETVYLPDKNAASRTGYRLMGWTCPDYMDGEQLAPGAEIYVIADLIFTPVWKLDENYTVTFSAGEGVTDATVPNQVTVHGGEKINVEELTPEPSRDGYVFSHWTWNGEEVDLAELVVEENMELVAVWLASGTFTFKGNFTVKGYLTAFDDNTMELNITEISVTLAGTEIKKVTFEATEQSGPADAVKKHTTSLDMNECWSEADLFFLFNLGSPTYNFYFFINADRTKICFTDPYGNVQKDGDENPVIYTADGASDDDPSAGGGGFKGNNDGYWKQEEGDKVVEFFFDDSDEIEKVKYNGETYTVLSMDVEVQDDGKTIIVKFDNGDYSNYKTYAATMTITAEGKLQVSVQEDDSDEPPTIETYVSAPRA